jgi:hypothetical protein
MLLPDENREALYLLLLFLHNIQLNKENNSVTIYPFEFLLLFFFDFTRRLRFVAFVKDECREFGNVLCTLVVQLEHNENGSEHEQQGEHNTQ